MERLLVLWERGSCLRPLLCFGLLCNQTLVDVGDHTYIVGREESVNVRCLVLVSAVTRDDVEDC